MSVRNERGGGAVKTILVVAVVLYAVFAVIKIVVAKADDRALEDKTLEAAKYAGVNREDAAALKYKIMKMVNEKGLPLKEEDLVIVEESNQWHVAYKYDNSQKLIFWTWENKVSLDKNVPKG